VSRKQNAYAIKDARKQADDGARPVLCDATGGLVSNVVDLWRFDQAWGRIVRLRPSLAVRTEAIHVSARQRALGERIAQCCGAGEVGGFVTINLNSRLAQAELCEAKPPYDMSTLRCVHYASAPMPVPLRGHLGHRKPPVLRVGL
jgi:hypothetical protein